MWQKYCRCKWYYWYLIGNFWVAFRLCFKASPSAKLFIWKLVLFTCKFWFIFMWIKLISIWKAWNRGERQLGHHLVNSFSPNSWSTANFSFQFIASYVWYSMEKLADDLLFGLKFVKLSVLPTIFIHFVWGRLGELRSGYWGLKVSCATGKTHIEEINLPL